MILATRIDQIKEIAEMNIAVAATRRYSKLAESEISGNKSPSSQRSSRISKDTSNATGTTTMRMSSMEICLGQSIVNDYGEVGRVVGIDSNGRPVLEVDDSDSVVEVVEKISTNVDAREAVDVVDLHNTMTATETCSVATTTKCPIELHAINTSMTDDDSTLK